MRYNPGFQDLPDIGLPTASSATQNRGNWGSRMLRGGRVTKWKGEAASCAPHVAALFLRAARAAGGRLLPVALGAGLAAGPAGSADLYWDTTGGNLGLGGTGTWNTSNVFWNQASDGVAGPFRAWDNTALDNAIFTGTAGIVTLGGPVTVHNMTFNVGGYTLTGGTITLAGTTPSILGGAGPTIGSVIAGTAGLTIAGTGTPFLTGANTFSGGITLASGGLRVSNDAALGALSNTIVTTGNVGLRIDSGNSSNRTVTIGTGTTVTLSGAGTGTALYTGDGGVSVLSGTTMSNDANNYTGPTRLNGASQDSGILYFTSVRNLGVASSLGAPTTVADGTITFAGGSQYVDRIAYIGSGDSSNRNWALSGSTARQFLNQGSGTLQLTGDISMSVSTGFVASSAGFDLRGVLSGTQGSVSYQASAAGAITLGGANTYTGATGISGGIVRASVLADSGLASSLGAGSTVNLGTNGILTYTGTGDSSNRTWSINGAAGISNEGTGALALSGDLSFNPAAPTSDSIAFGGTYAGTNTFSGAMSGTGNLVSTGSSIWELSGASTRQGTITVQGGTLRAASAGAFGTVTGVTVNGGTLDFGGYDVTLPSLAGTGGEIAIGSGTLTVNAPTAQSYGGGITGTGGLTKLGAGTLALTGASSYSGATTVGGGKLSLDFSPSGGPTNDIVNGSSPLRLSGGTIEVIGAAGETNNQSFSGLTLTAGSSTIRASSGTGGTTNLNLGAISRTGGLADFILPASGAITTSNADGPLGGWATINGSDYAKVLGGGVIAFDATDYTNKDDAGTWLNGEIISDTANAPNTPFFGTVNGNVQLGGLRYTAAAPSTVTIGAGNTLSVDGTIIVAPGVLTNNQMVTGGSLTGSTGGGPLGIQQNGAGIFTVGSTIVDNGGATSFVKGGTGALVLTGASTYTGTTTLTNGTLSVSSIGNGGVASNLGASPAASSNLSLEGGTLQYTGGTATTDRGFTLVNGGLSRTIEVTNSAADLTFTGLVTSPDDAGFTKTGAGTLTLANGGNNYVGVTTVRGGTLAVGTLTNGGVASGIGAASSDPANIVLAGGTLAYTGGTTSSNRGMTLGTGGGGIGVTNPASTLTLTGTLTGTGLRKEGPGTLLLAGTNTYSGPTTVNAGTLRAGSTQAFGSTTGPMTVNPGATLDLAGFNNTVGVLGGSGNVMLGGATLSLNSGTDSFSGIISGNGGVTRTGAGTQTFSGCNNTYTGVTNINGGTVATDCLANGGLASSIGASSAAASNLALQNNGQLVYTGPSTSIDRGFTLASGNGYISVNSGTTLEFEGLATGSGTLRKRGDGVLVLSGTNNYTGGSVVEQGILRAGSTSAFGGGAMTLSNTAGAVLDLDGFNNSVSRVNGGGANGGDITLGGATLTIASGNGTGTYSGAISGAGSLIKNGGDVQQLLGCNSSYTGATTINGGTVTVNCLNNGGANSSIGASGSAASNLVLNGGTLQYVGTGGSTDRQFTLGPSATSGLSSSGTGAISFTSSAAIAFSSANTTQSLRLGGANTGDNSLAAQITNSGSGVTSLAKLDAGTWILTNPNSTYTGATTISGGVLGVSKLANGGLASSIGAASAAASNLVVGNGSTLRYTGAGDTTNRLFTLSAGVTFIESSGTGAIVFTDTGPVALQSNNQARTIALGGTNTGNNTLAGAIGNAGSGVTTLAKNGPGTWVLTGNNTFTGNTVINDGNLMIGDGGTTGNAGAGNVIVDSATSILSLNRSDIFTFGGSLSGPGTLAQIGSGTSILTAASSSIGGAAISAGTLQVNGGLTTPTMVMSGTSALTVNGSLQGTAGNPSVITGDGGASVINVNIGGTLSAIGNLGGGSDTVTLSGTLNAGGGALDLGSGDDRLTLNDGAVIAGAVAGGAGNDTLQVNNASALTLADGSFGGFENLAKTLGGTLTLTGNHSYGNGTTIAAGTLQIGNGATAGALTTPSVANNGTLAFNLDGNYVFAGAISGSGGVSKLGSGITTLTDANSYAGATNVNAGTLLINGNQSGATGLTFVANGATLGGTGIVGGGVAVADGGTLSPGGAGIAPGELTINGDVALGSGSNVNVDFGQANVPGGPFNDLVTVRGNLTLDGRLNITQTGGGTFGPGIYRVFNYDGSLTDNGLDVSSPDYFVQTSVARQVNLVNSSSLTLSFWDGDSGPHSDSVVNGGDGTWRAAGDRNWTDGSGVFAAPFANASFAIFQGASGTVTVDNANGQVEAVGMQFATGGYVVQGGGIVLVDDGTQPGFQSIIRVGDGTAAGAGYVATIGSDISGATQLVKTDLGTLVLSGLNSYTSGTAINGGTVQISADANLGDAAGMVSLDGGTLRNTASIVTARTVTLNAGGGTFEALDAFASNGSIGGTGRLTKTGAGTLILNGANSYQGGTAINGGTVQVSSDANLGDGAGGLSFNGGTLHNTSTFVAARNVMLNAGGGTFDTDGGETLTLANAVDGAGALTKSGAGTLLLAGNNVYAGGTAVAAGTLQLGNGGTAGSIVGDVANGGRLVFNRSDSYAFSGLISGTGALEQTGSGTTILTGSNSFTGATDVRLGALIVNGDQSAAIGTTTVHGSAALGGIGTIGGGVDVLDGGALNPGDVGSVPGMLSINGSLALAATAALNYSFGQAGVVGGAYNDLTVVRGDLVLDGTINVTEAPGGNFGPGIYRVISYGGTLTDRGLSPGSPAHVVQTSIAGQVNLIDISTTTLNFWDGNTGPKNDSQVSGGNGVWRAAGDDNWTDQTGDINAAFSNGSFAIFAGAAGAVTVDNTGGQVQASGMQFATGGYRIEGDSITLVGPDATIRVGDGTAPGAAYAATIASVLAGNARLVKTDLGTLVLTGSNTYSGGTLVKQGTLRISDDANLGDMSGSLAFDGGTLQNTAAVNSARAVTLNAAGGTFLTEADLILSGAIGGSGGLTKTGGAALTLTAANAYGGPTTVAAGGLYVNGDQSGAAGPTTVLSAATIGGTGTIGGSVTIESGGVLNPGAADGTPGTLAIAGNLALSSGSILNYSLGEAGVAGGALNDLTTVGGNLVLDGTLNVTQTPGGSFGPGIYRIFSYGGTLTDNGLGIGTIPSTGSFIQTAVANQVNLVNTAGLALNYWDGDGGPKFDGEVNGGNGTWQNSAGNDNWTDGTGIVNAPFADASYAIFSGRPGTVTVDNSLGQVTASGMQFATDGYVVMGGRIGLDGPSSIIRVGDGTAAGAGMTATIASELSGGAQLIKTDLGTLALTGSNSYSGGTAINGGTLRVASDVNLGDARGEVSFNGGTLRTDTSFASARELNFAGAGNVLTNAGTNLTWNGELTGNGAFTKVGAGRMTITSDSSGFAGSTAVGEGILAVAGRLCGDIEVRSGGRLEGTGTVCNTTNLAGGVVAPGIDGMPGTLTIAGDYTGTGGTLEIESVLGGDASATDRLVVTGSTSGSTIVRVTNLGGGGAQTVEGIKIIDVAGAANGSFALRGDYTFQGQPAVVAGAYGYRLYKGGVTTPNDGDWYLRSGMLNPTGSATPLYQPGVPLYESYAGVLQQFNALGTLQQRVGNRSWGEGAFGSQGSGPQDRGTEGSGVWARIEAVHAKFRPAFSTSNASYDEDHWKLQAGIDGSLLENGAGRLIGGMFAHYGTGSSQVRSPYGAGSIAMTGYGLGATLTWYGDNGFYTDFQAQVTQYDSDLGSATAGRRLVSGNDGTGYSLSIEAGRRVALGGHWSLTPQVQLSHSSVRFSSFTDAFGANVSLQRSRSLTGRFGVAANYDIERRDAEGQMTRTHFYGIANLYHDFAGGSQVDVSGTPFASRNDRLFGGIGIGGSYNWANDKYSVYGAAQFKTSLERIGDSSATSGTVGFRVRW